jgi:SAM-dependent methyltransferase
LDRLGSIREQVVRSADALRQLGPEQVPQAALVCALWSYAGSVLYPARLLKRTGARIVGPAVGDLPEALPQPGSGRHFADRLSQPVMLTERNRHLDLVDEFNRLAVLYEVLVRPFSTPIFDEALSVISGYLASDSRILDIGCGPGRELRRVAALVPRGEVVGVDLAAGMVEVAHETARSQGIDNCAFFQADAGELPTTLAGRFDLVYSSLAHHHFPDPDAAAANALRCLRAGGIYCVIDPGPAWFNALSAPLGRLGDPGWIGWKTPEEFRSLLEGAGFTRTCWVPLLPGFGLAIGQKELVAR